MFASLVVTALGIQVTPPSYRDYSLKVNSEGSAGNQVEAEGGYVQYDDHNGLYYSNLYFESSKDGQLQQKNQQISFSDFRAYHRDNAVLNLTKSPAKWVCSGMRIDGIIPVSDRWLPIPSEMIYNGTFDYFGTVTNRWYIRYKGPGHCTEGLSFLHTSILDDAPVGYICKYSTGLTVINITQFYPKVLHKELWTRPVECP